MDERAKAQFGDDPLGQFKENWTIAELEQRFVMEQSQLSFFMDQEDI